MRGLCGTMILIMTMLPTILTMADPYCDCECRQQCEVRLHYYLHQFRAGPNHPNRNEEFVITGGPSGLGVMGIIEGSEDKVGQWSIMGGTGEFTNARGIIKYMAIKKEDVECIRELDIRVFYTPNTPSDVQVAKNITMVK
uniref:Dirigent protein n=1 Tax=Oryza punctata TaxID=4537 RepID=A0A0E0MM36_ORYPU